jgi:hypothetical protein
MTKKSLFLISLAIVLAGLYVVFFSGWLGPKFIRIEHTVRSLRDAWAGGQRVDPTGKQVNNVMFSLHNDYKLTMVKVVSAEEFSTNRFAHPLWHLVSEKGSRPVNSVSYGFPVPGMKPAVVEAEAQPLKPGIKYKLLVESRSIKGEHDFEIIQTGARR